MHILTTENEGEKFFRALRGIDQHTRLNALPSAVAIPLQKILHCPAIAVVILEAFGVCTTM